MKVLLGELDNELWMKLGMSVLYAVSFIYFLYLGITPIYLEDLQFVAVVSLIAAVVVPLSGMLETTLWKEMMTMNLAHKNRIMLATR